MKSNKILFSILIVFLAVISSVFGVMFCGNVMAEDEIAEQTTYSISSLSEISQYGLDKHYILKGDMAYSSDYINEEFTGIIDGNGFKIYPQDKVGYKFPLFNKISGGIIKNLVFEGNYNNWSFTNGGDGYLANVIDNNSLVENVVINNCVLKYEYELENRGLIAGVISNSVVSGVKITNSTITYPMFSIEVEEEKEGQEGEEGKESEDDKKYITEIKPITYNTNMGFIAGKIHNGSLIKNSIIENCSMDIRLDDSQASNFNFGGVAGVIENSTLTNNIINLRNEDNNGNFLATIYAESDYIKPLNIGGVAGKTENGVSLINNALILEVSNILLSTGLGDCNIGAMFGYVVYGVDVDGFVITTDMKLFGNSNTVSGELNYNIVSYNDLSSSTFIYEEGEVYWNKTYLWDKDENKAIWMFVGAEKYPVLQFYELFDISFNTQESKNSIISESEIPTNEVVSYTFAYDQDFVNTIDVSKEKIAYGSKIYLKVEINSSIINQDGDEIFTYYDKFFDISKLRLGGTEVFNNQTNTYLHGYSEISMITSISDENNNQEEGEEIEPLSEDINTSVVYCISNFNANYAGEYNVALSSKNYKLNVNVQEVILEDSSKIYPGKFTLDNTSYTQKIINLKYGDKITLISKRENVDYSDVAYWHIYNNMETYLDEIIPFMPEEENANFYTNKLEFTFNENCSLFSKPESALDTKVFDLLEYQELDGKPNYELKLVYTTRVKQVKIVFKDEEDNNIVLPEAIAEIMINNSSDNLIWNEEEGAFYAKVNFIKSSNGEPIPSTYIIKINQFTKMGYEFIDWQFEMGSLEAVEDEQLAGSFKVDETTAEPLLIICKLKVTEVSTTNNLLWLWITLACVAVLAIVITIIIVKKRKAKRTAYKKYFY